MRAKTLVYPLGAAADATGAFRALHRWALPDVVTVLSYHGLIDASLPVPCECFMPMARFERQMRYLARHFEVLHLEEALDPGRPASARPVACITFDDGLGSLHDLALPVLERLALPATVFLVTDLIDTDLGLWYTELHQAICDTRAGEVRLGGVRYPLGTQRERTVASAGLQELVKSLARPRFAEVFDDLIRQLGAGAPRGTGPWASMRILRSPEIRRMGRGGLVRFGSHTASHQILTRTDPLDVRRELTRSVAAVAALVERPSRAFAYPNGGPADFDDASVAAVRAAGLDYAVTTIEGPNFRDFDPYRIRRYPISASDHPGRFDFQVHHVRTIADGVAERLGFGHPLHPHDRRYSP